MRPTSLFSTSLALAALALALPEAARAGAPRVHEPAGFQLFASPHASPIALSPDGARAYVADTTSNGVSVIDTATQQVIKTVRVGIEPVSLAVRPDGNQVWVSNHVSDSVSVIDTQPGSPTLHQVVGTVQSLDAVGATSFDEPVGIAFASNAKAYVALSSRREIAIVDVATRAVTGTLAITAQDPRALTVRNGRLYVLAFESGNQSELSICLTAIAGNPQCTIGAGQIGGAAASPNLPGIPKNVVRDPDVPDRDLFVFDTATDALVGSPVTNVGTLLYGVAVAANGTVFVTNTDARNHHQDGNGLAAPPPEGQGLGLADLDNRMFRNRITRIACNPTSGPPVAVDLEPPPGSPVPTPLATPFGVALSADDSTLVVTAAASSRIATVNASTLGVIATLDVGAIPRGVAFRSTSGAGGTAYVLNALGNSVSVVTVGANGSLTPLTTVPVGSDPTPESLRLGRIAFESAAGSSSGTFACASCHPDAGIDDLLWVIGATCTLAGCDQEEQRSTMPVRGLRDTLPLHWDGTLGDPFGGPNGEVGPAGNVAPNCSLAAGQQECFRHLVNASLSGVMCDQGDGCASGGELTDDERDDMASFLQSVSYLPPRSRRIDDQVSLAARRGFADFFMDQGGNGGAQLNTCADTTGGCHALPNGTSTNSSAVGAFEAPTMRGMTDRFLHFSGGFTNAEELLDIVGAIGGANGVIPWDPADGLDELVVFSAGFVAFQPAYNVFPGDMFQMFEEASVGHSGALGRQVTLDSTTTGGGNLAATEALLLSLEAADTRGVVNLRGEGVWNGTAVTVSFNASGSYVVGASGASMSHATLIANAQSGAMRATLTANLRENVGKGDFPQPLLATVGTGNGATGDPPLPVVPTSPTNPNAFSVAPTNVRSGSLVFVDGAPVTATLACVGGNGFTPFCSQGEGEQLSVDLAALPASGTRLLQVMSPSGLLSNEMPICVGATAGCLQP
jgi:YVTN family beta-propeller protein